MKAYEQFFIVTPVEGEQRVGKKCGGIRRRKFSSDLEGVCSKGISKSSQLNSASPCSPGTAVLVFYYGGGAGVFLPRKKFFFSVPVS